MPLGLWQNDAVHPGKRVRMLRAERDWSLEELADKAQIHKMNLSKLERGLVDPRVGTLQKIADAFGVSTGSLVSELTLSDTAPRTTESTVKEGADDAVAANLRALTATLLRVDIFLSETLDEVRRAMAALDSVGQAEKSPRKRA
jgi:transcriptional regulator with XRE-family HTH domain